MSWDRAGLGRIPARLNDHAADLLALPRGPEHVDTMFTHLEDPGSSIPESARKTLKVLIGTSEAPEAQVEELDVEIVRCARAKPVARAG